MWYVNAIVVVFILISPTLQANTATNDFLSPFISPFVDEVCKEVECGKGKCKASSNSSVTFECECDPGWTQPLTALTRFLSFLPCVIPNCSVDLNCGSTNNSPPPEQTPARLNLSVFDLCQWTDCGGGTCNRTSIFTHTCNCQQGYSNLLNVSSFPCYKPCSLGMDCANVGIPILNRTSTSPPALTPNSLSQNSKDRDGSNVMRKSCWSMVLILSLILAPSWI